VPADRTARGVFVAVEGGVACGLPIADAVFRALDGDCRLEPFVSEAEHVSPGRAIAEVAGPARAVLAGERTALNLVQRMSGIATMTARYVAAVEGTGAAIVDTRKTAPGLRILDKYAVRCGGGRNHRFSLSDAVLVKDNHLAAVAGESLPEALQSLRRAIPHTMKIEVEVDRLDQIAEALAGGADIILLDNMGPDELRRAVALVGGRALTEASGGITLDSVRSVAESGVDLISVGALTHSVQALNIRLDVRIDSGADPAHTADRAAEGAAR